MLEQNGDSFYDEENSRSSVLAELLSSKNTLDCEGVRCQYKRSAYQKSGTPNTDPLVGLIHCFQHDRGCLNTVLVYVGAVLGLLAFVGTLLVASNARAQLIAMRAELQLERVLKLLISFSFFDF